MDPYKNLHGSHDCILGGGVNMSWYTPNPEDPQNKHFHQLKNPQNPAGPSCFSKSSSQGVTNIIKPALLELARKYRPCLLGEGRDFLKTPEVFGVEWPVFKMIHYLSSCSPISDRIHENVMQMSHANCVNLNLLTTCKMCGQIGSISFKDKYDTKVEQQNIIYIYSPPRSARFFLFRVLH